MSDEDREGWKAYWAAQGMPWRTEPEIGGERQRYLAERRAVRPDIGRGIYPFRDVNGGIKLTRADVEWLLATHESAGMHGPVDWSDNRQRLRPGLDLRGADLRRINLGADRRQVDASGLPLARLRGGLALAEWLDATDQQRLAAGIQLDGANLTTAHLERADLRAASMIGSILHKGRLESANLTSAHLEQANLTEIHLEDAYLSGAHLEGSDVREASFDGASNLRGVYLSNEKLGGAALGDIRWGGVNLGVVTWFGANQSVPAYHMPSLVLGDERQARSDTLPNGIPKSKLLRVYGYVAAVRAYRQLATALREQGLNEDADRFAYRAQKLQRQVFRRQRQLGKWLFSLLLAALSGYGYRLGRILFAYGLALVLFAAGYFAAGQWLGGTHLTWYESLLVSLTAIHGRVFFTQFGLDSLQSWVAAVESVVGIVIEGVFVAMLIQRFFAR